MINPNTTATSMDAQDLTIEQLVGDITGSMIKSMNSVLEPLVMKINKNTRRDTVINDWLKQLPEFQQLLLENKKLEEENALYKNEGHITMHITEKPPIAEETTHVKTIKTTLADYTLGADQLACMRSRLDDWRNRFNSFVDTLSTEDSHYELLVTLKQDYDGICYELLVEPARSIVSKTGDVCKDEPFTQSSEKATIEKVDEEEVVDSEEEEEEEEEVVASEEEEDLFVVEMEDDAGNMIEYLTNDDQNGFIFVLEEGDGVGKKVGKFVNGEPELFAD